MSATLREELAEAIARGQVVIVVGAGVSMAATGAAPVAGWGGLLEDGVARCVDLGLSAGDAGIYRTLIQSGNVNMMVSGAEFVTKGLGGPESGEYRTWLRGTVGSLTCRSRDLIEALADLGALIATTNYDGLLEEVTQLRPVTWRHPGDVQRVLQGDERRIIHLHGYWEEPESVVLGVGSYGQVMQADAPQEIQQALTVFKKLVFVGCGEGLNDPNFHALRSFLRKFQESESRHYRLCTAGEAEALRHEHEGEPIRVLPYGEGHGDLLPFLRALRPPGSADEGVAAATTAPIAEPAILGTAHDVPPPPPGFLDRPDDVARIRTELLGDSEIVAITGVTGPGGVPRKGVGKGVLAARVAKDEEVRRTFVDGIYWVELGSGDIRRAREGLAERLGIEVAANDPAGDDRLVNDLREALAERRCLVVLADVPTGGHLEALKVTGPQGRTLCTAIHRSIVDGSPAAVVEIDVPGAAIAVRLLENAAGLRPGASETEWDPGDVERILAATGRMPHALALAGAAIGKGGRTASAVADDLENGRFLGYAESYAAMWVALGALPDDDARRYRQLAIFPDDEPIPLAALERLWGRGPEEVRALVETLTERSLVTLQTPASGAAEPAPAAIRVKRALLLMLADDLKESHLRLVQAYADRCSSPGDWASLPYDEPYIWDHLVYHLHAVRDPVALQLVARDVGFLAVHAHLSGPHAVQRDLAAAAKLLPEDSTVAWLNRFLETSGHLLAGHPDLPALAASLRLMLLDAPEGIDPGRLESLSLLPPLHLRPLWRRPRLLGALVREACLYETAINALAFSVDGRLASGGSKGILRVWDSELLGQPIEIPTGVGAIRALAFGPGARAIVAGGSDGSVRIWDIGTRTCEALAGHGDASVCSVAISPDGSQVASCADDGSVRMSRVGGGPAPAVPADAGTPATAVAFSPTGDVLALGGDQGRVRIWDLAEERETMARDVGTEAVTSITFSPDGGLLALGEQYGGVGMWDLAGGREPVILEGPDTSVMSVAFSPAGEPLRLASGSDDGSVRLWQPRGDGTPTTVMRDASSPIRAVAFSPAGDRLASGDVNGRVRIWDVAEAETGQPLDEEMTSVSAIAMSPDGQLVAAGGDDGQVRIREAADGRAARAPLEGGAGARIGALAFSADSDHLAWSGGGGEVHLWSRQNGGGVLALRSPRSVRAVAVSPDGRRVAAACADGHVRIWDAQAGSEPRELVPKRRRPALAIAFSADGRRVFSGGQDGPIMCWEVEDARDGVDLADPGNQVNVIACSPQEARIAFGCEDGRIGVLDERAAEAPHYLEGHADEVNALAFSSDGSLLASAATDGSAHLLEISSGEVLLQADAGVLGLGLAWTGGRRDDWTGSRVALLLDGAVLLAEMVDRR